jgi:hypothetical protein
VSKAASLLSAVLIGGVLLAGCGGGKDNGTSVSVASEFSPPKEVSFRPAKSPASSNFGLTKADARKIRASALHNHFVREVSAGSRVRAYKVVPVLAEGEGGELVGGSVRLFLNPPVEFDDQKLPATISPNQKAPPGTPPLYRYVRMSATNVSELEVQIQLANRRAVRIEPAGDGYKIGKLKLIGPPPKSPAYAPEPGY